MPTIFKSYDDLAAEAERLIAKKGIQRQVLAAELGVTPAAITFAVNKRSPSYERLLIRIIEHLCDCKIVEERQWRQVKKVEK
jgi:predicted transcriptional regulator